MANDAGAYRKTLLTLWVILPPIAYFYSKQQNIPTHVAIWLLLALLLESIFYLAPGFQYPRSLVESIEPPAMRAAVLTVAAILPYCVYALGTGTFHLRGLAIVTAIAAAISGWFVVFTKRSTLWDVLFVGLLVAALLSKVFDGVYITVARRATASILGQLMLIRTGAFAVLSIRKMSGISYGFLPTAKDWTIGGLAFVAMLPVLFFANHYIGALTPQLASGPWWRLVLLALGTFLASMWVVVLSEEMVFRGILLQSFSKWAGPIGGLLITSILFGLVHLPFRGFPNWRWVALTTILGLFCGIAAMRARSIRAAMVTHSLVIVTWRIFFA